MLYAVLLPLIGGALLPVFKPKSRRIRTLYVEGVTILTSLLVLRLILTDTPPVTLLSISGAFRLVLCPDGAGKVFLGLIAFLWPLSVLYGSEYMEHEERENTFFAYYTMTYGVMVLFCCAYNVFTLYVFFECITLVTLPLVWHKKDSDSIRAARSYIRYSIGCAALAFTAMILLSFHTDGEFSLGGSDVSGMPGWLVSTAFLFALFGFGVKAAVFPLSQWLPKACAAPTPVTALLHAVAVVNASAFAAIRVIYYVFGTKMLTGTWGQTVAISVSAFTVVYGAVMAVRETHVKRKLAYSTISNLSYILLGASLMTGAGMVAAFTHMIAHGLMKITLFFCIGAVMVQTGRTQMKQMHGLARVMPLTFAVFVFAAIALMGMPPLAGFVSKYYLLSACVSVGSVPAYIGAGALLVSAILTAIYTLSVLIPAYFLPLNAEAGELPRDKCDPGWRMLVPLGVLLLAITAVGVCSEPILKLLRAVAGI